jgi:mannose/fructose/sorbose-specific phosphotransferase system IID component
MTNNKEVGGSKLTKNDYRSTFLRSLCLQGAFNYERMQTVGFAFAMVPALKRLYPEKEKLSAALKRHLTFFNTCAPFVNFILGTSIALEEQNTMDENFDPDTVNAVKAALMGPLAGIGDSFFWGTFRIIAASIGTSLTMVGNPLGILLYILIYAIPNYTTRIFGFRLGYSGGVQFIQKASSSGIIDLVTRLAKIVGAALVGGMIATMVNAQIGLIFDLNGSVVSLQGILDSILPKALPLLLTFGIFLLIKRGVKTVTIMLALFVVGIAGKYIGLF